MPQFELANAAPQIAWLVVIFALLYLTLRYGALPKVEKVVADRATAIGSDLAAAERVKGEAEAVMGAYEALLDRARADAGKVTGEAKAEAARDTAVRLKNLETELDARLTEASSRIEAARTQALANLDLVAQQAAADIVERLTGRRPSPEQVAAAVSGVDARAA